MFWSRITCICLQVQVFHGDSVSVNLSTCVLLLYVVWAHLYSMQCLTLTYFQCLQNILASWRSNCTLWYLSILILRKCTQNCKFDICHSQGNIGEIFVPKRRTDLLLEIIPFSSWVFLKHPYYGFHNFQNDIHLCYFPLKPKITSQSILWTNSAECLEFPIVQLFKLVFFKILSYSNPILSNPTQHVLVASSVPYNAHFLNVQKILRRISFVVCKRVS